MLHFQAKLNWFEDYQFKFRIRQTLTLQWHHQKQSLHYKLNHYI